MSMYHKAIMNLRTLNPKPIVYPKTLNPKPILYLKSSSDHRVQGFKAFHFEGCLYIATGWSQGGGGG